MYAYYKTTSGSQNFVQQGKTFNIFPVEEIWTLRRRHGLPGVHSGNRQTGKGIPIVEIGRFYARLISAMVFPILASWHLYI